MIGGRALGLVLMLRLDRATLVGERLDRCIVYTEVG